MVNPLISIVIAINYIVQLICTTRGVIADNHSSYQYTFGRAYIASFIGLMYMVYDQFFHMDIDYAFRYYSPIETAIFSYNSLSINALCLNTHGSIIPYRQPTNSLIQDKILPVMKWNSPEVR